MMGKRSTRTSHRISINPTIKLLNQEAEVEEETEKYESGGR